MVKSWLHNASSKGHQSHSKYAIISTSKAIHIKQEKPNLHTFITKEKYILHVAEIGRLDS